MDIIERKNAIIWNENCPECTFNGILDTAEERIRKTADRLIGTIQTEAQKKTKEKGKKMQSDSVTCGIIPEIWVPEREERERHWDWKKYLKKVVTKLLQIW